MIARFRVALPFPLTRAANDDLRGVTIQLAGYEFVVKPPFQALFRSEAVSRSAAPLSEVIGTLRPADPPELSPTEQMDGAAAYKANALEIDVHRDSFDRRRDLEPQGGDPPVGLFLDVANSVLRRLRGVTQAGVLKPISERSSFWRLEYLADDGSELPFDPELIRRRNAGSLSWSFVAINRGTWEQALTLPVDYRPQVWEVLYQDALTLLPERGPALVLTAASLETLILQALDTLAARVDMPSGLWEWINDRDDYRKEPSVEERFDVLLSFLVGRTLKDEQELWQAFKSIKNARNSFVHTGAVAIGGKEVTLAQTHQLMGKAGEIIGWVEQFLPDELRRPLTKHPAQLQYRRAIVPASAAPEA